MGSNWSGRNSTQDDYPHSYAEARDYVARGRNRTSGERPLSGKETMVRTIELSPTATAYAVRYWDTDVVTFYPDGAIELRTDGHETPTTAIKMNACLPKGYIVGSVKGVLMVFTPDGRHKANGYRVTITAEQWAEDAQARKDAAEARAAWQAEQEARHAQYIADGDKPHVAQVWLYGGYGKPSELTEQAGPFDNRSDAQEWYRQEAEARGYQNWHYFARYITAEQAKAEAEATATA